MLPDRTLAAMGFAMLHAMRYLHYKVSTDRLPLHHAGSSRMHSLTLEILCTEIPCIEIACIVAHHSAPYGCARRCHHSVRSTVPLAVHRHFVCVQRHCAALANALTAEHHAGRTLPGLQAGGQYALATRPHPQHNCLPDAPLHRLPVVRIRRPAQAALLSALLERSTKRLHSRVSTERL